MTRPDRAASSRAGGSLLFALTLGAASCAATEASGGRSAIGESAGQVTVGKPLPDLEFQELDGRGGSVAAFRGKVVLLDIWASWCEPCKEELPQLDGVAARLRSRGVEVLAISVDQDVSNVRAFLKRKPGSWSLKIFHDPTGQVAERLQPPKMPTSYVIDRAGVVRLVNEGYAPRDVKRLEAKLEELAAER